MNEHDIPVERIYDGDVMTLGESDAVTLTVIQELHESWPLNDQSAMLMVQYGDRRILLCGRQRKPFAEILR